MMDLLKARYHVSCGCLLLNTKCSFFAILKGIDLKKNTAAPVVCPPSTKAAKVKADILLSLHRHLTGVASCVEDQTCDVELSKDFVRAWEARVPRTEGSADGAWWGQGGQIREVSG